MIDFLLLGRAIQRVRVHRGTTILVRARSHPLACLHLACLMRQRQVRPGRGRTCVVVARSVDWQLGHRHCVAGRQGRPRGAVSRSCAACRRALVCTASVASECARVKDGGHTPSCVCPAVCPAVSSRHATRPTCGRIHCKSLGWRGMVLPLRGRRTAGDEPAQVCVCVCVCVFVCVCVRLCSFVWRSLGNPSSTAAHNAVLREFG